MEELKDASIHHTALKLVEDIKNLKTYGSLFKTVQKLVSSPEVDKDDMKSTLETAIKNKGLEVEIRNIVFHLIRATSKHDPKSSKISTSGGDPLNYLRRAGIQWERRVKKSLNAMCAELKVQLPGQIRAASEKEDLQTRWEELSNFQIDLSSYRPVYAPKDLLEVLLSLKGPPRATDDDETLPKWEFSHIALHVKNIQELRVHYMELLRSDLNIRDWPNTCARVLRTAHAPLCQQVLRKGVTPVPMRGPIWAYVLGSTVQEYHHEQFELLKKSVLNTDLIVDKLVFKDIQLTATNDDQYFVFEDVLYQVMLCFSRDIEISQRLHPEFVGNVKGKPYEGTPSGVVPFHGICMFAAPFCYLYDTPVALYFTFRAFYIRYCHRLTTVNTHPQGIVSLCLLYEKLLQTHEPHLWSHLRELQIQPIRIVFKWLMRAYSGHLPPEQLLILWDLVLGYDSLEILSLLAVIILSFRKESLMQVQTIENIEAVLADLSSIKILPLIQLTLSRD